MKIRREWEKLERRCYKKNSRGQKANVIPFSFSEKEVRENFLDFIIRGDATPIDIACSATIVQITKQYYPVRCFYVTYSADWDATSIWEHKEQYTEYETKTVYIDYRGQERSSSGYDYQVKNGQTITHYRRPMQKTIPVKKTKTVVDNVERTDGGISDKRVFLPVFVPADSNQSGLGKWIESQVSSGQYGSGQITEEYQVQKLQGSTDYAKKIAGSQVEDRAYSECRNQVPGSRYEDFSVSNFSAGYKMDIVLVPVYYITYSYNGESFECWRSGTSVEKWYSQTKPQDISIAEQNQQAEHEINGLKKKRLKAGAFAFVVLPISIVIALVVALLSWAVRKPVAFEMIALAVFVYFEVSQLKQFKKLNKGIDLKSAEMKNMKENIRGMKEAIAEVVKRPDLDEEQQKTAIRDILNGNYKIVIKR